MFRKTLLSLAGLLALATPAASQLMLTGAGGVGSAPVSYSAGGVMLQGEALNYNPYYGRTSALAATSDGGKGIISFWAQCQGPQAATNAQPRCVIGDIMMHRSVLQSGAPFSEAISGLNVILDTAAPTTAGYGTLRLSTNSSSELYASAPQFGLLVHDAIGPSDYTKMTHFLIVWDHSTNTFCGAVYKNGVAITSTHNTGTGFNANYSNASGFVVGSNAEFGSGSSQGNKYNGSLAEVYMNLAPASTPCVSDAIANYSVSSFYNAGNPVNLGANCATPTGAQPVFCYRWDASGVTAGNEGYGGAFTATYPAGISAAPLGPGKTATAPYLKYITGTPGGISGNPNPFTPSLNNYTPVAGDLIIVYAGTSYSTAGASTITLTTANGFAALGAGSTLGGGAGNYEVFGVYYKIAAGGDAMPTLTLSRSSTRVYNYVVAVYGNADQSAPIGTLGTWANSDPAANLTSLTCSGFTPGQSGSLIASLGYVWNNTYTTESLTGNGSQNRFLGYALSHGGGSAAQFLNDYTNTGTTVVGSATVQSSTADSIGCYQFEIKHP